jgi:multidrug efflux pump subunit AcrB
MTANFNLSSWALRHRALVWFLMVIVATAGSYSYWRLGRSEDPPFTTKTMIVRVDWPGATVSEMLDQVTDRVEEKLQETPHLDYLRSFTTPGETTIFVNLLSSTPALAVPDAWYQVHKKIGDIRWTLPPGIVGPFFNDEFGDTYGIIYAFTADGFTQRELRDYVKAVRRRLLTIPDVAKIELFGTQDEKIFIEFSPEKIAGLHLSRQLLIEALQAQNAVTPAGTVRTRGETLQVQVAAAFTRRPISSSSILPPMAGCSALATSAPSSAATLTRRNRASVSTASKQSASALQCGPAVTPWRSAPTSSAPW